MDRDLRHWRPGPALAGVVHRYTGFAVGGGEPERFVELPCSHIPLILDMGEGWSVADARSPGCPPQRLRSFVAGLTDGPVLVGHGGSACSLQVDLTPLGARRLLGLPMSEIANRSVDLEDVLGAGARDLTGRLADAPGWAARVELVERALVGRLAQAHPPDPGTGWALGRLRATGGAVAIGDLATELGWSHRRLIARFRRDVGLAPKAVARIIRFEHLRAVLCAEPGIGLARAAAGCGFSDQAHLAREVRDLAHLTPTQLRDEGVNFLQEHPATLF